ncbi:hypothetical protein PWT90_02738 [Aphanocladium album]|nr:hypothetical protein PWT90_02738 [Aphanocladium album]
MAFWVLGTGASGQPGDHHQPWHPAKQDNHSYDEYRDMAFQPPPFDQDQIHHTNNANGYNNDARTYNESDGYRPKPIAPSIQIKNLAFLVIREQHPDGLPEENCDARAAPNSSGSGSSFTHVPPPRRPAPLERTESGLPISDTATHEDDDEDDERGGSFLDDLAAAQLVRDHVSSFQRRCPDSQSGRILRSLINPKHDRQQPSSRSRSRHRRQSGMSHRRDDSPRTTSSSAAFPLDNDALRSVFSAANELFFANRLARRVAWDWSHPGSAQYQSAVVGTTALRRSAQLGGWETLIVLSSPVLRDTRYNRRLLLSTFLHEMIHSFLFVTCGRKAGRQGGHTEGFRQIAEVIDAWVGKEYLRLSDMQADLQYFEDGSVVPATPCMAYRQMVHDHGGAGAGAPEPMQRDAIPAWQLDNERNVWPPQRHGGDAAAGQGMYLNEPVMPPPPQFRHPDDGAWQWYEREGFQARDGAALGMHY